MADSDVTIIVSGRVDPSLAGSVAAAKASMADLNASTLVTSKAMSAALLQTGGDLSKVTPAMLGLQAATAGVAASTEALAAEQVVASKAADADTLAVVANTRAKVSNRAATEGLVIAHEILSGRYSRVAGSAMIMGQAMSAGAGETSVMAAALNPLTLGLVAVGAGLGYLVYLEYEQQKAADATAEAFALTGRAAQASGDGIMAQTDALTALPDVSRKAASALLE
ncbi:MAG TPA: hypothetical protein VIJ59_00225, partial [Caulobacteraceae bacterium]